MASSGPSIETLLRALIAAALNVPLPAMPGCNRWGADADADANIRNLLAACKAAKYSYILSTELLVSDVVDREDLLLQVDAVIERLHQRLETGRFIC